MVILRNKNEAQPVAAAAAAGVAAVETRRDPAETREGEPMTTTKDAVRA